MTDWSRFKQMWVPRRFTRLFGVCGAWELAKESPNVWCVALSSTCPDAPLRKWRRVPVSFAGTCYKVIDWTKLGDVHILQNESGDEVQNEQRVDGGGNATAGKATYGTSFFLWFRSAIATFSWIHFLLPPLGHRVISNWSSLSFDRLASQMILR